MNKRAQYYQQAIPGQCKSEVEEMYLSNLGNSASISENTGSMQQIIPIDNNFQKLNLFLRYMTVSLLTRRHSEHATKRMHWFEQVIYKTLIKELIF